MNIKTTTILTLCAICAAMSGCVEPVDHLSPTTPIICTPTPEIVHVTPTPTPIPTISNNSVVIVMDISGSMRDSEIISESGVSFLDYEKGLVITILGDKEFRDDYVGVVGFGSDAYTISTLECFENESTRESLKDTIRMIALTGHQSTSLEDGLSIAEEMLANSTGAKDVIILSDGNKIDYGSSLTVATRMKDRGVRIHFIHVVGSPTSVLSTYEKLADTVGAMYYQTSYPKSININTPISMAVPRYEDVLMHFLLDGEWVTNIDIDPIPADYYDKVEPINNVYSYLDSFEWADDQQYELGVFDCSNMVVWLERHLERGGCNVQIRKSDNHAWIMVEINGSWIAYECTTCEWKLHDDHSFFVGENAGYYHSDVLMFDDIWALRESFDDSLNGQYVIRREWTC